MTKQESKSMNRQLVLLALIMGLFGVGAYHLSALHGAREAAGQARSQQIINGVTANIAGDDGKVSEVEKNSFLDWCGYKGERDGNIVVDAKGDVFTASLERAQHPQMLVKTFNREGIERFRHGYDPKATVEDE